VLGVRLQIEGLSLLVLKDYRYHRLNLHLEDTVVSDWWKGHRRSLMGVTTGATGGSDGGRLILFEADVCSVSGKHLIVLPLQL